ncbi:MAG: polyphenol oxidase family protein [Acidobacteriota bacterium]
MIVGPVGNSRKGWMWSDSRVRDGSLLEVRFAGRGMSEAAEFVPSEISLARCRQEHSARVLAARPGDCGAGDALVTDRPSLALAVVTADCVPVLLAAGERLAAVHAGWRGLAAEILPAAVAALEAGSGEISAWIGPAIGSCCYEVGEEVAGEVVAASDPAVRHDVSKSGGPRRRPHLDLSLAALHQLAAAGVRDVRMVPACTRCEEDLLCSYRRDGPRGVEGESGAGRNMAIIWRTETL